MKKNALILFVVLLCNSAFIHSSANSINTLNSPLPLAQLSHYVIRAYFVCGSLASLKLGFYQQFDLKDSMPFAVSNGVFLLGAFMNYFSNGPRTPNAFFNSFMNTSYTKEDFDRRSVR
jgi:hypothetical protein